MIEAVGWVGQLCFAICALPQAIQAYKDGHSNGVNPLFLLLWLVGEVLSLIYVGIAYSDAKPIIANYIVNLSLLSVILYFKFFPRATL